MREVSHSCRGAQTICKPEDINTGLLDFIDLSMSSAQNGTESQAKQFSHLSNSHHDTDTSYVRSNPDLLCVVVDVDPATWAAHDVLQALPNAVQDLCIFINAHAALRHDNCCAIYVAGRANGNLVFSNVPSLSVGNESPAVPDANTYQPFKVIDDAVQRGVTEALDRSPAEVNVPPLQGVVSSLAQALCHINRVGQLTSVGSEEDRSTTKQKSINTRGFKSRILVLSASPDSSSQYVSVMNCIFGAQKQVSYTLYRNNTH